MEEYIVEHQKKVRLNLLTPLSNSVLHADPTANATNPNIMTPPALCPPIHNGPHSLWVWSADIILLGNACICFFQEELPLLHHMNSFPQL